MSAATGAAHQPTPPSHLTPQEQRGIRRADIQGLRAFAVLAVIAFHAGLPVPGGFVGVDVFFVISGFVITGMLNRERLAAGRIRFGRFYARRMARLVPALGLLVAVTSLAAVFLLSPLGVQQLTGKTGVAGMLSLANGAIAVSSGGYFLGPAERNPLLNLWSLSVEEQFYYVFPFVLAASWLVARRFRTWWLAPVLVAMLGAASYVLMAATVNADSFVTFVLTGFYSPLSRAWEFAAGAILALIVANLRMTALPRFAGEILGIVGAAVLFASLWLIGPDTPFPSSATLLPVTGTVLVILAGSFHSKVSERIWGSWPLTWTGDRSYSLYLWHWPFIVFAVAIWPLSPAAGLLAALVSVLPSVLSYRFVETRFRRVALATRRQWLMFLSLAVLVPIVAAAGTYLTAERVWRPMYVQGQFSLFPENIGDQDRAQAFAGLTYPCADETLLSLGYVEAGENHCYQSKPDEAVDVAIIGDSHAEHLYPGIARSLPTANVASYFAPTSLTPNGSPFDEIFRAVVESDSIDTVVINAFWVKRGVPVDDLAPVLNTLTGQGKQVIITSDVPGFPFDPEVCKYRLAPVIPASMCDAPRSEVLANHDQVMADLTRLVEAAPNVLLVDTWEEFCEGSTCSMAPAGSLLYRDEHHVNEAGSALLAERIVGSLDEPPSS